MQRGQWIEYARRPHLLAFDGLSSQIGTTRLIVVATRRKKK
jgi:hypothetical protein